VSLGKFVDENKTQLLKDKGLPIEGCAAVAGRTDKGVTALQQVCSFCKLFPYSYNAFAMSKLINELLATYSICYV
jgi:tRNA U38,U39,U40 pseudouridine synthase TruA